MNDLKDIHLDGECIQFDEFDFKKNFFDKEGNYTNPRIAVIAKSGSGKSWIIRDILYHIRDIDSGVVIAPTDVMTGFYDGFIPPGFVHHDYNGDIIAKVLGRQKAVLKKNKIRKNKGKKPIDPRTFLIMDDCMSKKGEWLKDPNVLTIFNEGRHYQLTFILAMQYSLGIQPELRSNFDYIFLLGEDFVSNRKKLYEHYAGMFRTKDLFEQVFMQITDDYGCMVINNRLRSSDIKKKVFWYKAKPRDTFVVGSKTYLRFNRRHYDKNHGDRIPTIDLNSLGNMRNKTRIHVQKVEGF
jgi:hypothetical protein